jgi:hypothetical protein
MWGIHLDSFDFAKNCSQSKKCYQKGRHQMLKAEIEGGWGLVDPELDIYSQEACMLRDHIDFEHLD